MGREVVKVYAPATVANVGVGFDILGFAIDKPGDDIILRKGTKPGLVIKEITGANGKLPLDVQKNTAGYAAYRLLEHLGETDMPLEMVIRKKMPFSSGLGSSAASAVAGVFAVNELLKTGLTKHEILKFAVEGEQIADGAYHGDNVAPSLLGGIILIRDNATLDVTKLYTPKGLMATVIYPHIAIRTEDSRNILSDTVTLQQHIAQNGNMATLVAALYNSDFDKIGRCLNDVIIEPQRAQLIPHFYKAKEIAMQEGALGYSISGAGPSMFALSANTLAAENISEKIKQLYTDQGVEVTTYVSSINQEGAFLY